MKRNTKEINQVKLLRQAHTSLSKMAGKLNRDEFNVMVRIFSKELHTNILLLHWSEADELLNLMEAGKLTNSAAERLAQYGGRIETADGNCKRFIIAGNGFPVSWEDVA